MMIFALYSLIVLVSSSSKSTRDQKTKDRLRAKVTAQTASAAEQHAQGAVSVNEFSVISDVNLPYPGLNPSHPFNTPAFSETVADVLTSTYRIARGHVNRIDTAIHIIKGLLDEMSPQRASAKEDLQHFDTTLTALADNYESVARAFMTKEGTVGQLTAEAQLESESIQISAALGYHTIARWRAADNEKYIKFIGETGFIIKSLLHLFECTEATIRVLPGGDHMFVNDQVNPHDMMICSTTLAGKAKVPAKAMCYMYEILQTFGDDVIIELERLVDIIYQLDAQFESAIKSKNEIASKINVMKHEGIPVPISSYIILSKRVRTLQAVTQKLYAHWFYLQEQMEFWIPVFFGDISFTAQLFPKEPVTVLQAPPGLGHAAQVQKTEVQKLIDTLPDEVSL